MSTPAKQLTFKLIREPKVPVFGDVYEDITRKGANTLRLRWVGMSSAEADLAVHRFFKSRGSAMSARASWAAAKGYEVDMISELHNNHRFRVFVLDVVPGLPTRVETTLPGNYDWKLEASFRVRATK